MLLFLLFYYLHQSPQHLNPFYCSSLNNFQFANIFNVELTKVEQSLSSYILEVTFNFGFLLLEMELGPAPCWIIQQFGKRMTSIQRHIS